MGILLTILQGLNLATTEIIPIGELVAKLKSIFALNPNAQVSIQNLAADAIQADDDTLTLVAQWQKDHGLPVTVTPPPSA